MQSALNERLVVEVLADGAPVARVLADDFRSDVLNEVGGDGKYGFSVLLPEVLFDDNEHVIEVQEVSTGFILSNSPQTFQGKLTQRGNVSLEGGTLVGWTRLLTAVDAALPLEVIEKGQVITVGHGMADLTSSDVVHFRLPLPIAALDGRPHLFSIRSTSPPLSLGDLAVIPPPMLTPEYVLREYAREGLKPTIATAAGFRYDSFTQAIERVVVKAEGTISGSGNLLSGQIQQLVHAHACLVRGFSETDEIFKPLNFPVVEDPRVSIVIPVHNKFYMTYHCLASLSLAVNRASFEVILVDDGSKDESTQIPDLIQGVQYIRNDETQGFIRACNFGSSRARGEYIVILNNDTEVTSGWLDELIWPFEHFDNVGLTGAKLLYADGTLQEAGGMVSNNGDPWNYGRQANPHDPSYNYARQVDYLSGACIMLPRTVWKELDGFDETFAPAYFEDTDLAFRVRANGYKTVYAPLSQVIHFEGVSSGTSTASGVKQFQEINRPKFKQRWSKACRHNGKNGVDLALSKDRNIEFRALILDAETPMPDKNAGSYAAIQEMRMLQALGFKCTFAPTNLAWMEHYTKTLQRMGVECLYAPYIGSINEVITSRGSEFDLIYITRFYVAQHYIDLIRQHAPQAKIVLNNADLHFLRELRAGLQAENSELIEHAVETREAELTTMSKVDLVLCYTDVEKAVIISHNIDSTRVAKCPWVIDVTDDVPGFEARSDIAFLGGYNHHPNAEAIEWFTEKVMPLLRDTLPGVTLRVYGSNVPKRLLTLADKYTDIAIEGWVTTVDTVYNTCRVFIAPLQSGAGIKGKVIGALAHGVPCVLSPIAAEGISLGDGVDAMIASKPEEWAMAIARLYQHPQSWADMSRQALVFARNQYSFVKGVAQMQEALQQVEIFTTTDNNTLALR